MRYINYHLPVHFLFLTTRKVKKYKWVMIYINTFIENYYIIKYLVVNANILYNLPVEKEEKEKDEMD